MLIDALLAQARGEGTDDAAALPRVYTGFEGGRPPAPAMPAGELAWDGADRPALDSEAPTRQEGARQAPPVVADRPRVGSPLVQPTRATRRAAHEPSRAEPHAPAPQPRATAPLATSAREDVPMRDAAPRAPTREPSAASIRASTDGELPAARFEAPSPEKDDDGPGLGEARASRARSVPARDEPLPPAPVVGAPLRLSPPASEAGAAAFVAPPRATPPALRTTQTEAPAPLQSPRGIARSTERRPSPRQPPELNTSEPAAPVAEPPTSAARLRTPAREHEARRPEPPAPPPHEPARPRRPAASEPARPATPAIPASSNERDDRAPATAERPSRSEPAEPPAAPATPRTSAAARFDEREAIPPSRTPARAAPSDAAPVEPRAPRAPQEPVTAHAAPRSAASESDPIPTASALAAPSAGERLLPPAELAPRRIKVQIGRVTVRAPAPPARPEPRSRPTPRLSLSEYLRRRGGSPGE